MFFLNWTLLFFFIFWFCLLFFPKLTRKFSRAVFIAAVVLIFSAAASIAYLQYQFWLSNDFTKLFLPPHQSPVFFLQYILTRFFGAHLISLAVALIGAALLKIINRRAGGRFFYNEEPVYFATAAFLVGHPNWLIYILVLLIFSFSFSLLFRLQFKTKANFKISFYSLWVPSGIIAIIIGEWLARFSWWNILILAAS